MKKRVGAILISIILLTITLFTGCGPKDTVDSNGLSIVKVAFDNAPSEAGVILGDKLGYFEKQGIKIEYVKFNSGQDELSSIAANQVDIARGIISAGVFNAANQGIGLKLVADGGNNIPGRGYFAIAVKKGSGERFKEFKDLKGAKIAIASVGSINQLFVEKALEKGGLTSKDIELVVVDSFPDMNTAVATGKVDGCMQIEPLITQGVKDNILEFWKDPDEYAVGEEISVIMYSSNFVKKKELAKKFMVAYLQGVRAYNDAFVYDTKDQDKMIDILTKTTFVTDPEVFRKMRPPGLDPNGHVLKGGVISDQKWYMKNGYVKKEANIDKLVDDSYVQYALSVLGEYKK